MRCFWTSWTWLANSYYPRTTLLTTQKDNVITFLILLTIKLVMVTFNKFKMSTTRPNLGFWSVDDSPHNSCYVQNICRGVARCDLIIADMTLEGQKVIGNLERSSHARDPPSNARAETILLRCCNAFSVHVSCTHTPGQQPAQPL